MLFYDGNIINVLVIMLNFLWFFVYFLFEGFGIWWLEKYGYWKIFYFVLLIFIVGLVIYEVVVFFYIYMFM